MALSSSSLSRQRAGCASPSPSLRAQKRRLQGLSPFRRRARPSSLRASADGGGGGGGSIGGSGGGSSGGGGPGDDDNTNNNKARTALIAGAVAAAATAAVVVALSSQSSSAPRNVKPAAAAATPTTPTSTPTLSLATSDDVSALKRLLREAFESQLHARRRLDALERAAADAESRALDPPEAGDEVVPGARSLNFAPGARERAIEGVRVTGGAGYRGILVWANGGGEGGGGAATGRPAAAVAAANTLLALGACADAGVSLYVHHHSPSASNVEEGKDQEQQQGDGENGQAAMALDATPLGGSGGGGAAAPSSSKRGPPNKQQPWHSRDRRITVRLASVPRACDDEDGGAPLLQAAGGATADAATDADADDPLPSSSASLSVRQVLVRLRPTDWLHFLVAPLGGSLASLARPPAPLVAAASAAKGAQPAATRALRRGHDLTALRSGGVGKAVAVTRGAASLALGHFVAPVVAGEGEKGPELLMRATTSAQLALHPRDGESAVALSLARVVVGAQNDGDGEQAATDDDPAPSSLSRHAFLGASAPGFPRLSRAMLMPWLPVARGLEGGASSRPARHVLGASWSAPVGDALAATAWAERAVFGGGGGGGGGGWGVSLRTRADEEAGGGSGPELGVVLARASTALGRGGGRKASAGGPLYCEVSARLPGGEGACVTPGMIVTLGGEAPLVAYTIAGAWRF